MVSIKDRLVMPIEWVYDLLKVAVGAVGVLALGVYKAHKDADAVGMADRSDFTKQLIARLSDVEDRLREEREHYEKKLAESSERYRLIIHKLTERIEQLEDVHNGE